jgi:hypothetical protein
MILTSLLRKAFNGFPLPLSHRILKASWNIIEMGFLNIVGLGYSFSVTVRKNSTEDPSFIAHRCLLRLLTLVKRSQIIRYLLRQPVQK